MKGIKVNKNTNTVVLLRVDIFEKQKTDAKKRAKAKGYSFQGGLRTLIKEELKNDNMNQDNSIP